MEWDMRARTAQNRLALSPYVRSKSNHKARPPVSQSGPFSEINKPPVERVLSEEERERLGLYELLYEERDRTGSPCPQTEARLGEINARRRARGEKRLTVDQVKEMHREISQASGVHDPADLPPG